MKSQSHLVVEQNLVAPQNSAVTQNPAVLSPSDAEQRLRQAARILATGAIRAALKNRQSEQNLSKSTAQGTQSADVSKPDIG